MPSAWWVVPFGDPRVNGHLRLTGDYRSLSRPSSPVRAKASAMRPFLLSLFGRGGYVIRAARPLFVLYVYIMSKTLSLKKGGWRITDSNR